MDESELNVSLPLVVADLLDDGFRKVHSLCTLYPASKLALVHLRVLRSASVGDGLSAKGVRRPQPGPERVRGREVDGRRRRLGKLSDRPRTSVRHVRPGSLDVKSAGW
jgi:hypothetical protein